MAVAILLIHDLFNKEVVFLHGRLCGIDSLVLFLFRFAPRNGRVRHARLDHLPYASPDFTLLCQNLCIGNGRRWE